MPNLLPGDIDDIVNSTLNQLGRFRWTDISFDIQKHVAFTRLISKNRVSFQDGKSIDMNAVVNQGDQARWTALWEEDVVQVQNLLDKGNMPWSFIDTHFGVELRELKINSGASQIVSMIQTKRNDAMKAMAGKFEQAFWGLPDTGTTNRKMYGLPYWVTNTAAAAAFGFNGTHATGFTDAGGLSAITYPNWKCGNALYVAISQTDLNRKWREAMTKCEFVNPVAHPSYEKTARQYSFYTNYNVIGPLEEYLEDGNENIGNDIASRDGALRMRGIPVEWVPHLEANAVHEDPVYGVDWSTFNNVILRGEWMRRTPPEQVHTNSHNARFTYYDSACQLCCNNRRRNFVLDK